MPEIGSHSEQAGDPSTRLRRILRYANTVFALRQLLAQVRDRRQQPRVPTALIVQVLFLTGLLRTRSFNALEPKLSEPTLKNALGMPVGSRRACSVDTLGYSLARMDVGSVRRATVAVIKKAERNKIFREGWFNSLRFVGIDGWEPFCSRRRHCPACLTRRVKAGEEWVTEYYHRFVVALLIDSRLDLVLDMEPVRSADVRADLGEKDIQGHEGELTAAKRLVPRLRSTYGRWLDVLLLDALYSNGPFLTLARRCRFGVIATLKKDSDEPLKEALDLWRDRRPDKIVRDEDRAEEIEMWDCPDLETLSTFRGKIRVVRARVHSPRNPTRTWCFAVIGVAASLGLRQIVAAGRSRWHLENTGFNQWIQHWKFNHVFKHGQDAVPALFWIFFLAFNLLQLFIHRHLPEYGRCKNKDVTKTILRLVDEFADDLAKLLSPISWDSS